jgi:RimJ/RimL family protein N-acetyltransferase
MEIATERLILREFQAGDWPAVLAYQSDPRYLRYYAWTGRSEQEVRAFVQIFIDQQRVQPRIKYQLAVTLRETRALIGNCGIRLNAADAHEGNIGYELDPRHWGHGYATEAVQAIVRFGFVNLGLHRVWATCIADNVGSARVLEKVGMRLEGRLWDKERFKGRWWDALLYAILEDEWQARVRDNSATRRVRRTRWLRRLAPRGDHDPAQERPV